MQNLPQSNDPNLLIGTEGFSDSSVYRLSDQLAIVQSLDFFPPLVDDPYLYGQIAAANSLSDIYAMGARPVTALNIVGFPDDKLDLSILGEILQGGADRVQLAGAVVGGGHSVRDVEIKYGLSATGVVDPARMLSNQNAQPGDTLLLSKPLGTGFVTTAFKAGRCPQPTLQAATDSMKRLNAVASQAAVEHRSSAVTDITGFGLIGHAMELAISSKVTLEIQVEKLPLLPGAYELARVGNTTRASATNRTYVQEHLRVDYQDDATRLEFCYDAQTSGGLLISVPADRVTALQQYVEGKGELKPLVIGQVVSRQSTAVILQ